jgi:hypothetical protein
MIHQDEIQTTSSSGLDQLSGRGSDDCPEYRTIAEQISDHAHSLGSIT